MKNLMDYLLETVGIDTLTNIEIPRIVDWCIKAMFVATTILCIAVVGFLIEIVF